MMGVHPELGDVVHVGRLIYREYVHTSLTGLDALHQARFGAKCPQGDADRGDPAGQPAAAHPTAARGWC